MSTAYSAVLFLVVYSRMISRDEALMTLHGGGVILEVAREISRIIRAADLDAAIIGGVAVVLHGHVRTTLDVDVYVDDADAFAEQLALAGFEFNKRRKEFVREGVPVHLVTSVQAKGGPRRRVVIDDVLTVSLPDLIAMKLRSGLDDLLRARDLADVIDLIRVRRLTTAFAAKLDKSLRADFRQLAQAVGRESRGG